MIEPRVLELKMTIANINEALEYWFKEVVFKNEVTVSSVSFSEREHFTIKFK